MKTTGAMIFTYHGYTFVIIIIKMLMSGCCVTANEQEIQTNEVRFFFTNKRPVKPTAAITHHEPGLPPGWTRPPTRPTRPPYNPNNRYIENATLPQTQEFTIESQIIDVAMTTTRRTTYDQLVPDKDDGLPPGIHPPMAITTNDNPNKNVFVDWILGLFGRPTQKPTMRPPIEPTKCTSCACGIGYKYNRIVGGVETKANAYPWMVYLTYSGRFYCGASVINDMYVLTAAHCISGFPKERLSAIFLDHDRSTAYDTKTFTRRITNIIRHGGYGSGGTYNNDIALLRLNEGLDFSGLVKPVCLPPVGKSFTGYTGIVTGWGATEAAGQVSNVLREVKVPILSNNDCRNTGYGRRITDNMMCAGYNQGMKDSCQGDSGGPMHITDNSVYTIVGIVSWGEGCAQANYPGVYTRVNRYISWIKSNTKDACYC